MGINFLGTFLLTNLLLPLFRESDGGRIVNVTSDAYKMGKLEIDNLENRDTAGMRAYSDSKLALMMFTMELAERETEISVNAVHPGHVRSGIWNFKKWYTSLFKLISGFFMISAGEGAAPVMHAALSESLKGKSGRYFYKMIETQAIMPGGEDRKRLWKKASEICGL